MVFFVSTDFESGEVVFDCVFVIGEVLSISDAETRFPNAHPARHYHFDQERCPSHKLSTLTRIADPTASFIPTPPMPLGSWIECHVSARSMPVLDYFRMKKRKNVRVVTHDAQGIYDRLVQWSKMPGHAALACLPMQTLREIQPEYPAEGAIDWGG
ncbi:MAG: hypothetical protein Q8M93_15800 [Polaromonas sp.]|uniref:hypothetical protein n=1 Tax=Polaromonas sp. TaxID=1869339 RepID=UPI00272F3EB9|nr:hypothetical protein [Polaromonas sp.]MDP2449915.1 hypothetical protein [Polaromonas sp.]MDP3248413.1 hypothetical protein [Polaromonas sp.]MDP3757707.1 hypothetical protein [Polaromonas sp.]